MDTPDLKYISYAEFCNHTPSNINVRDEWNVLSEQERYDIYCMVHSIINNNFEYIGEKIDLENSFPRNFDYMLSDCNYYKYNTVQRAFLERYNKKVPEELKWACISLGRDIIKSKDYEKVTTLMDKNGLDRIDSEDLIAERKTSTVHKTTYNYESVRFLNQFRNIYFGMMRS